MNIRGEIDFFLQNHLSISIIIGTCYHVDSINNIIDKLLIITFTDIKNVDKQESFGNHSDKNPCKIKHLAPPNVKHLN